MRIFGVTFNDPQPVALGLSLCLFVLCPDFASQPFVYHTVRVKFCIFSRSENLVC